MSGLSKTLADLRRVELQGSTLSDSALAALRVHRRNAAILGFIVLAVAIAAIVITAYSSLLHVHDPQSMKLVAAGLGLSFGGALLFLRQIWRTWAQSSLLLVIIEDANDAQIDRLLDTLIGKI